MNIYTYISDTLTCLYLAVTFTILIELKYSLKVTFICMVSFVVIAIPTYSQLMSLGISEGFSAVLAYSIPSFVLCFVLSKNRDFRFVFTFCSVDVIGLIIVSISRAIAILFNDNQIVILMFLNVGFACFLFLSFKTRKHYIEVQQTIDGWTSLAVVSILFYVMMILITSYPTPMITRREYLPVLLVFIMTIISVYVVIHQTVVDAVKIDNEKKDRELLETKLALQNSQLELKEVYFRMAYEDAVTGLKNRAAFEEKKKELTSSVDTKSIVCLMIDLNNLKETNDVFGHNTGDELIKSFSDVLRSAFDNTENIFRIGGDEFIVLFLEESDEEINNRIAELKEKVITKSKHHPFNMSFAMGLANIEESNIKNINSLILCADKRMYENKKQTKCSLATQYFSGQVQ